MPTQTEIVPNDTDLFATPTELERFNAIADPEGAAGQAVLRSIARKIGRTRVPGARSDIPAGATYFAQFVVHDLDFLTRDGSPEQSALDLALIYGDGPKHDAFCYQIPAEPGTPRYLLRLGRTRPTAISPAWGAMRDLPRTACPHLDGRGVDAKTEVLVPNGFSDSNMLLGQMQTLWALCHNAIAGILVESRSPGAAFEQAQAINRGIYRDAIIHDLFGTWLMPRLRERYPAARPGGAPRLRAPLEFIAGVARLGHGLVREVYSLSDQLPVVGLRSLMRQTSTGRPFDMPLTEDWLVDFAHFFAIGSSTPQRARALGPHVARPVATGAGLAAGDPADDSIVRRDLLACTRGGLASVRTLIGRANRRDPSLFDGCFAQDEGRWIEALRRWLSDTDIDPATAERLAQDPPLTLFLMLEAEADTGGRTLGALGSVLMAETLSAALPAIGADPVLDAARDQVFQGPAPRSMAELIGFLQRHYKFAEGARLHPREDQRDTTASAAPKTRTGETSMFDNNATARQPIPRIEVADFIEMGRLVAEWSTNPKSRPANVAELVDQLDGIATVPERIKHVEFVQSTLDTLILRLPVKEMLEESIDRMSDPMATSQYPLPQFYADHYRPGFGPVMTSLDTLLARVGDYTIAQCR